MSSFFLDLKDKPAVVDFLVGVVPFVPEGERGEGERGEGEKMIHAFHDGERLHTNDLAACAERVALASWSARMALSRYTEMLGAEEEWKRMLAAVRPTTATTLKKMRKVAEKRSLGDVLATPEARELLSDEEVYEVEDIRRSVREEMWEERQKELTDFVKQEEVERGTYEKIFAKLDALAEQVGGGMGEEIRGKVAHYRDRVWFAGERIPMEVLEGEAAYYVEQREIRPED